MYHLFPLNLLQRQLSVIVTHAEKLLLNVLKLNVIDLFSLILLTVLKLKNTHIGVCVCKQTGRNNKTDVHYNLITAVYLSKKQQPVQIELGICAIKIYEWRITSQRFLLPRCAR